MTVKASFMYAIRLLIPKRQTSSNGRKSLFGAIFGIALSIIPLVVVLVVADGMIEGITERIIGLSSYHLQAVQTNPLSLTNEEHLESLKTIKADLLSMEGVENAFIERQGVALAVGLTGRTGATIRAVEDSLFTNSKGFTEYVEIIDGVAAFPESKSAVIGKKIAETLELGVGDTIRLMTTQTIGTKIIPKLYSATISGIVSSGYEEIDALWVFLPLEQGFNYLSTASSQVKIGIETPDPFSVQLTNTALSIVEMLPSSYYLFRWNDLNTSQFENYASTRMLLMLIMFLILLIAAVNISAALIMTSIERQKEIAILKSIGASSNGIVLAFLITGVLCAIGGLVIGLPLGILFGINFNEILLFCENFFNEIAKVWYYISSGTDYVRVEFLNPAYYLETIPVTIPTTELIYIFVGTIVLSILVSIAPAVRAGKESPLEILRKN